MINITVTVTGPGGCINTEVEIIRRALESVGCTVDVTNKYPHQFSEDPQAGYSTKTMDQIISENRCNARVSLIADHEPWGG